MREHLKQERYKRKLAELLNLNLEVIPKEPPLSSADLSRIAESVLLYFRQPELFTKFICEWCEREFATNKHFGRFCSRNCSIANSDKLGIPRKNFDPPSILWSHHTAEPIKITPDMLQLLDRLKTTVFSDHTTEPSFHRPPNLTTVDIDIEQEITD